MCMHIPSLAVYNSLQLQWDHVHAHSFSRCIQLYPATALLSLYTHVSSCNGIMCIDIPSLAVYNCLQLQWDKLYPAAVGLCACTFLRSLYTTVSSCNGINCIQLQWDHVHAHSFSRCIQLYPAAVGLCACTFLLSLYATVSSCNGIMCMHIPSLAVYNCIQLQPFSRCIHMSPAAMGSCASTFLLLLYTTVSSCNGIMCIGIPSLAVYNYLQLPWDNVHAHSFSRCMQQSPAAMGSCACTCLLSLYTTVSSCSGIMCIDIPSLAVFNCIQLQWDHSNPEAAGFGVRIILQGNCI